MKKAILILSLALISAVTFAQAKKDTVTANPVYNYFVVVPMAHYQQLVNSAHGYRDELNYDQFKTADVVQKTVANIDYFLQVSLPQVIRLDSVAVKPADHPKK